MINKIDLAPLVGANLEVMKTDTVRMRANRPFVFSNLKSGQGVEQISSFIIEKGGLASRTSVGSRIEPLRETRSSGRRIR